MEQRVNQKIAVFKYDYMHVQIHLLRTVFSRQCLSFFQIKNFLKGAHQKIWPNFLLNSSGTSSNSFFVVLMMRFDCSP